MAPGADRNREHEPIDRRRLILGTALTMLIFGLCLFVPAGSLAWPRGWLFFGVVSAALVGVGLYLRRVNPDVVAARVNRYDGTKSWDRVILALLLPLMIAILPIAALDDGRYHWYPIPWWAVATGYVLLLVGMAGMTWAEAVNKHFEPTVRIQTDRVHTVVTTGPYAIVRHPGYTAAILLILGMPLCLGSLSALIPAILCCLVLLVRTVLEDRMLRTELPGYEEYAQRVRCRLVPGAW